LFVAAPEKHAAIARALGKLRRMEFRFEPQGSRIIFVHQ
jgi:galactokinase/mevalonate kinase-like predicted kinase